jgi:small-conductance mechanosensitive channel
MNKQLLALVEEIAAELGERRELTMASVIETGNDHRREIRRLKAAAKAELKKAAAKAELKEAAAKAELKEATREADQIRQERDYLATEAEKMRVLVVGDAQRVLDLTSRLVQAERRLLQLLGVIGESLRSGEMDARGLDAMDVRAMGAKLDAKERELRWSRAAKEDGVFVPIDHAMGSDGSDS